MATFSEHFNLIERQRSSLELDPEADASRYVDFGGVIPKIEQQLKRSRAGKVLVEGAWGQGKSHTLHHIERVLLPKLEDRPHSVFVTVGGLGGKSGFLEVYQQIFVRLRASLEEALIAGKSIDQTEVGQDLLSADAMSALVRMQQLLKAPAPSEETLGRYRSWVTATGPTPTQAMKLGLGSRLRDPSNFGDLVGLLRVTGQLYRAAMGRGLALFIDESAAFSGVLAPAAVTSINEGLRGLVDNSNKDLTLVLGLYRRGTAPFLRSDVLSRLGDAQVVLPSLRDASEVQSFVTKLWPLLSRSTLFTPEALSYFSQQALASGALPNTPGQLYPRGLLQLIDRVAQRAYQLGVSPPLPLDRIAAWLPSKVP